MGISLKPSEMLSGGLLQDVDVRVTKSVAAIYDYNGKAQKPALAIHMTMVPVDGGEPTEQYYSAGSLDYFAPSEDDSTPLTELGDEGKYIVNAEGSTATALSKSSNFAFFLQELVNAGFSEDRISSDVSVFEGMVMHVVRKSAPKREGFAAPEAGAAPRRENTVLVPSKILQFPWDVKGTAKGKSTAAAVGGKGGDLNATAVATLKTVLEKQGGSVAPADARKLSFAALVNNKGVTSADRTEIGRLLSEAKWLEANQGDETGFAFVDGLIVSA